MKTYKLIRDRFDKNILFYLSVFVFFILEPISYSKSEKHILRLKPEESFEVRNGRIIYLEHCAPCHGITGKGDGIYFASALEPKPKNFTNSEFMNKVKDEYLFDVITNGTAAFGKSPYCPPWGKTLKEKEKIKNIISFLRTFTSK